MFRTLDLYEAISDNWQQIKSIFSFKLTFSIQSQAVASQIPVLGNGIHSLMRYVLNYIARKSTSGDGDGPSKGYLLEFQCAVKGRGEAK
ncbi:hypothetical protein RJT34_02761 [Clitoria ternatea]|uniref:Exocyst complex subunit Exo70 C-terminal domain-containing protein n=1 Tax=Clitoria ternatea TaxID=43366 RepID=A0AAN9Q454_CLITE